MKATTIWGIPYPEDTDPPDGPTQIKALADYLDTLKWGSRNLRTTDGIVAASGDLTLANGEWKDVPGASVEIAPVVASKLKVTAIFDLENNGSGLVEGALALNGTRQSAHVLHNQSSGLHRATLAQVFILTLPAEKHTIKLQAQRIGENTGKVEADHTRFLYEMVAS
jgi:hypothetical protein